MEIITSVLIISLIAAALAAVIVVANKIIGNYGECKIVINDEKTLTVQGGSSLLESLTANRIFIPSACGGKGTCAYCKVQVLEGGGILLPTEEPYLDARERKEGVRLSCQVKVRNDIQIKIPEELFRIREYTGTCTQIRDLTYDMKEFRIELKDPAVLEYTPGQYIQLFCPSYNDNEEVYRAYSIASDPNEKNAIELVIRRVPNGICTTWCFDYLKEGDPVKFNGPYGEFHLSDADAPIIFIAGGSGVAPIKNMLHHMKNQKNSRSARFFFGAGTAKDLCYMDLMKEFEKELSSFRFIPVLSRSEEGQAWDGETGLVTECLDRQLGEAAAGHEAYLCGSPGMIDASIKILAKHGIPESKMFYDKFA